MVDLPVLTGSIKLPDDFEFGAVRAGGEVSHVMTTLDFKEKIVAAAPPTLGPLAAFVGDWTGTGFNTIFRPDSTQTPTPLPIPVGGSDNILELNLTAETLTFSSSLGSVPNRGSVQADVFLNGVPYLQAINDVTTGQKVGIHLEPGIWIAVPQTTDPALGPTLTRMASIPHGTTIVAQGTSTTIGGPPTIPTVDITPTVVGHSTKITFASQTAAAKGTPRIPQDLTSFINAGTITQAMLTDPNTVLRDHIHGQTITSTTIISIATAPARPLFGGGTDNIAFLLGDPAAANPNANATQLTATFWIETVEHILTVPIFKPGEPPLILSANPSEIPGRRGPTFLVHPPMEITTPRTIKVQSTQIQYSQEVMLVFKGLSWPHVSVATLVPAGNVVVPSSVW